MGLSDDRICSHAIERELRMNDIGGMSGGVR